MKVPALKDLPCCSTAAMKTFVFGVVMMCAEFSECQVQEMKCWSDTSHFYPATRPCFGIQCRCNQSIADCSSNEGRLQFVPQFRFVVKVLNFSNNGLREITRDDFFLNVSQVTLLDLYNNELEFISEGAFQVLRNLTVLLIGGNKLTFPALKSVFRIPTLRSLDLLCEGFNSIPQDVFANSSLHELTFLTLSWNSVSYLQMSTLQPLRRLSNFRLWHNTLNTLETARMPCLQYLNFAVNRLFSFPQTCHPDDNNESLFPMLITLNLEYNEITSIQDPVCLPELRLLILRYNRFEHYPTSTFGISRFPSLQNLDILGMQNKFRSLSAYAFNNSNLIEIDMAQPLNAINFSTDAVDSDVFGGCPSVRELYMDHNDFQHVSDDKFYHLFRHLTALTTLYLRGASIETIPRSASAAVSSVQGLFLYHNLIQTIPDGAFDDLLQLEFLELSGNQLSQIAVQTFSQRTRLRLKQLDLSLNPFRCDCEIIWFREWLLSNSNLFKTNWSFGYQCTSIANETVQEFHLDEQACMISADAAFAIICITSFLMAVLFVVTMFFRFRWHIRLLVYEAFRQKTARQRDSRHFPYDVFVGYVSQDTQWVTQELLPVLEGRWNLRACVHERDFRPGKHIIDNIADSVQDSHKILMVFSPDFARSEWCQFELKYCQSHVMDRDDVLIIVILQETQSRDMTAAMLALLRTTTYIQWSEEPDATTSFWGRLKLAFNDILQRNVTGINLH